MSIPDVQLSIHEDLAAVEREWHAFEQRSDCTVFQSFGWLSTWHLHVGRRRGTRPAIVTGRGADGELLFLLPFAVEGRGFARCLTWLGSEINDYNAPMLAPGFSRAVGDGFGSLWSRIRDMIGGRPGLRFDFIRFARMPPKVAEQPNPFMVLPVCLNPSGAHLAQLAGDWDTFYASRRSSATRRRDRRKLKHLEEIGAVRLITPWTDEELADSFDVLVEQKTRSFAAMGIPNFLRRPGYTEFYRSLVLDPRTRELVHLSRLEVGAIPAAIGLGLNFRGSYYLVISSYDGELSRLSPGSAHLHELMRHAIDSGCKVFDFTVGDEPYKSDWSETGFALFDHVSAVRWHGAFIAQPVLGLTRAKRAIKQTPALWKAFSRARAVVGALLPRPGNHTPS